jgi:methylmalonyl-CoA mutase C-terminal domain/subunit
VAVIGLSSLSGAHLRLFTAVIDELKKADAGDIKVLGGGIIPDEDMELLKEAGVEEIFTPGASLAQIVKAFTNACDDFYGRNNP